MTVKRPAVDVSGVHRPPSASPTHDFPPGSDAVSASSLNVASRPGTPPDRVAPPTTLVDGDSFRFGTYDGPIPDLDLLKRWRGPGRVAHAARLKEWQAFQ